MSPRLRKQACVVTALGALSCALAHADASLTRSPFLPPDYERREVRPERVRQEPPREIRQLELRGIMKWGGKWRFSLYDPRKNKGSWVGLQDKEAEYYVVGFDPDTRVIALQEGGQVHRISLKSPDNKPVEIAVRPKPQPENTAANETDAESSSERENKPPVRRRYIPPDLKKALEQSQEK